MKRIVVATGNQGKIKEIKHALKDLGLEIAGLDSFQGAPEVIEDKDTFEENAAKKALAIAGHTGEWALADDSGLVVDALQGAPGVRSARFAGEDATDRMNNQKLLAELERRPGAPRTARFIAVLALASPQGETIFSKGSCEGEVLSGPRGSHGFGYDPIFFYPPLGKTFAEITREQKLEVSHRGAALQELKEKLAAILKESRD